MDTNNDIQIIDSWSLIDFARKNGKMKVGTATNHQTNEQFKSCAFINGDSRVFVNFSSKLGPLSAKEIAEQKDGLQVVQLSTGSFRLCRRGEDAWEEVDLF